MRMRKINVIKKNQKINNPKCGFQMYSKALNTMVPCGKPTEFYYRSGRIGLCGACAEYMMQNGFSLFDNDNQAFKTMAEYKKKRGDK